MKISNKFKVIIFFVAVLLSACGPAYHLKQAKRHELIAISKGAQPQIDTFYKIITYRVREIDKDTLFLTRPGDTVRISRDKLKIVYVDLPGDSVYVAGKCEADTILVNIPVTVTKVIQAPDNGLKWWVLILIGFIAALVLCFALRR